MARLTIRGLSAELVAVLKARAAQAGRSAEVEHRRILEEALRPATATAPSFLEAARTRRIKLPPGTPSTTNLLRQDRDRDGAGPEA